MTRPLPLPSEPLGLIMRALAFASHKHRDQRRKDAEASPYINHPIALANILTNEGGIKDPIVTCHNHGISIAYSKLSYTAMMALDAGLDTGDNCLLLCK